MFLIKKWTKYSRGAAALAKYIRDNGGDVYNRWEWPTYLVTQIKRKAGDTGAPITIINWGFRGDWETTGLPQLDANVLNKPEHIMSSKLKFFKLCAKNEVNVPQYTTDIQEALGWEREGHMTFGRKSTGHGGKDIKFFEDNPAEWSDSKFWSKYIPNKHEYRIHFAFGQQIDSQRKAIRKTDKEGNPIDTSTVDTRVRNHSNGFVFIRESGDLEVPDCVVSQARKAYEASKLDFGALDVLYSKEEDKAYVLEINSAPGLTGSTVSKYGDAFINHTMKNNP